LLKGASLRNIMVEGVPYIDTTITDIGVSQLRKLNATDLREAKKTLVVRDNNEPLAVVLKYEQFLVMQNKLEAALKTVDLLTKRKDAQAVLEALQDAAKGKGVELSEISPELTGRK
jgi:PHD/YefM family antitoxin component YafN of YafNO toxin-antitoxin module